MNTDTDQMRHHRPLRSNATFRANQSEVQEVTQDGRDYLVFPLIAAREMVLDYPEQGTRELLPANSIEETVHMWAGTPLTFVHPDNRQRTADRPEEYTGNIIGEVHEPEIVDSEKLRVTAWLDIQKALDIGGMAADVVRQLQNGEELSVSAGYATIDDSFSGGRYNGEEYDVEQGVLIPDHVAVFPSDEFRARCSPEDGCAAPRANAVVDTSTDDMSETENTTNQDVAPEDLSLQEHVAPALASYWEVSTGEAQSFIATIAGEESDRDVLAALVANEYDNLDPVDVQTVLSRAEEGDITVNATTLGKMFKGAMGHSATVDPSVLNQHEECDCGAKTNAEGASDEPEEDSPESESTESESDADTDTESADAEDDEEDDDDVEPEDRDPEDTSSAEESGDEESSETDSESDEESESADEDDNENTDTMPEVLSIEDMAAKTAFGVATLQEWDEEQLNALEATILELNPELAEQGTEEAPAEGEMNAEDDEESEEETVTNNEDDNEFVTKDDFEELKAMVEDAVNSKANAEVERQAQVVANAIDGMSVDAAKALPDDELETLAEKHGANTANYGAVAAPVDRQPEPEEVDEDFPAGGRSQWEERQRSGGDD